MPVEVISTALVRLAAAGDRSALAQLLEAHAPTLRSRISPLIPNRWRSLLSVDDVMQETYTDAFLGIGEFTPRGDGAFQGWLLTVARNNVQNAVRMLGARKRGGPNPRHAVARGDDSTSALLETLGLTITTPSKLVGRKEAGELLVRALEQLPADHRQTVQMYDLEGYPAEHVASILKRSVGAVYMLRARALRKLRDLIGSQSLFFTGSRE